MNIQLKLCGLLLILTNCAPSFAEEAKIEWRIVDGYRLLKKHGDQEFMRRIADASDIIKGGKNATPKAAGKSAGLVPDKTSEDWCGRAGMPRTNSCSFSKMPDTYYDAESKSYSPEYVKGPADWQIAAHVAGLPANAQCEWLLDKNPIGHGSCGTIASPYLLPVHVNAGEHELAVKVRNRATMITTSISPKDILIVGMGNSYGAGEGIPDVVRKDPLSSVHWLDKQCHRSLLGWESLVSAKLAFENPHASVTFVGRACSGAEARHIYKDCNADIIEKDGNDACYNGVHDSIVAQELSEDESLQPQIKQLRKDLCIASKDGVCQEIRRPDIVLLSIGGNDAKFSTVIKETLTSEVSNPDRLKAKVEKKGVDGIAKLNSLYPDMFKKMLSDGDGLGHNIKVVLPLYPNPTFRSQTEFCGRFIKDGDGRNYLKITSGYWIDWLARPAGQLDMINISDDFINQITGSVKNYPEEMDDGNKDRWGLRQIGIGMQCMISGKTAWSNDPMSESKNPACHDYWGQRGFSKFEPPEALNLVYLRNIQATGREGEMQINGFVFNGYCLPGDGPEARWVNTYGDSMNKLESGTGTLHPNIYGQMYYVKHTWPVVKAIAASLDSH